MRCTLLILLVISFTFSACKFDDIPKQVQKTGKMVIIDTDMMEALDDGFAMMMTALSDSVDVLGVTTVSGNTWAAEGVAYAIRQLEISNRTDIPVYQGESFPLDTLGTSLMKAKSGWAGAASTAYVSDWLEFYRNYYHQEPSFLKSNESAVDFLINKVHQYAGEVTLLAIGPCTNIARAIQKDSLFVRDVKEIIYNKINNNYSIRRFTNTIRKFLFFSFVFLFS